MAPTRPPTAGQASVEYVAAVTLAAAILAAAGTAVGAPGIARGVVHGIRTGICVVGGDVCRPSDAAAAGLQPCTMASAVRGRDTTFAIAFFTFGKRGQWTASRDSQGRITLVHAQGGALGVMVGLGLAAGPLSVGASTGATSTFVPARAWQFPNAAAARRFLAGLPDSEQDRVRYPLAWHTLETGAEGYASAGASLAGHVLAGVRASADAADGLRIGPGPRLTISFRVRLNMPSPSGDVTFGPAGDRTELRAEYTLEHGSPRELAFHRLETNANGTRLTETVGRLDLRDPANRAAAAPLIETKLPWPPTTDRQVHAILRRMAQVGTIERATYAVTDHSTSQGAAVELGAQLGVQVRTTHLDERLLSASAWTHGSHERKRVDCLGGET